MLDPRKRGEGEGGGGGERIMRLATRHPCQYAWKQVVGLGKDIAHTCPADTLVTNPSGSAKC